MRWLIFSTLSFFCAALIALVALVATEPPLTFILLGFALMELVVSIWFVSRLGVDRR